MPGSACATPNGQPAARSRGPRFGRSLAHRSSSWTGGIPPSPGCSAPHHHLRRLALLAAARLATAAGVLCAAHAARGWAGLHVPAPAEPLADPDELPPFSDRQTELRTAAKQLRFYAAAGPDRLPAPVIKLTALKGFLLGVCNQLLLQCQCAADS